jgi:hypothetical protein
MRHSAALLPALLLSIALAGCTGPDCDTMAALSVLVTVVDEAGADVQDVAVTYQPEGRIAQPCEETDGEWACGWEVSGAIEIVVAADGYLTHTETVEVTADECHVQQGDLNVVLEEDDLGLFAEDRVYSYDIYATEQECTDAMALGLNCYQVVEFCADGEAALMLTDIINPGTYSLAPNLVTAEFPGGDAPGTMVFTLTGDTLATDDVFDLDWERNVDPVFSLGACQ